MISAHQNMPEISVNYFCVENNYFIVALCNLLNIVIISPKNLCPQRYHYIQYVLYTQVFQNLLKLLKNIPNLLKFLKNIPNLLKL